ncbi:MAG: tRNA (adenosine(37)-N6)-threonylcarbamoyltransferase complex ATPase subunit type 1 TsaE [Butyrivibrio sp.]|nr:tRNA (adenosine(37)-N6)-threonylcarbamoyltransferase complex ATPase subunit type 1 TsaE [Butyrivibrio sp.]
MEFDTFSSEETYALGQRIAQRLGAGAVVCLDGDLGAGKTVLAQGIARGLGIDEPVCSPTFTLIQEYGGGRLPLYHFDVYRIDGPWDMDDLGYEEYFYGDGVCLVEWGCLIKELLPENTVRVSIERDGARGFDYRRISISGLELG